MPAEIRIKPGVFTDAAIAACVASTITSRLWPSMMISCSERQPSGNAVCASGLSISAGQYFSYVLANRNGYLLPAFEPLPATPPGNGMMMPGTLLAAATPAIAALSAASSVSPRYQILPPIRPSAYPSRRSSMNSPPSVGIHHILRPNRSIGFSKPSPKYASLRPMRKSSGDLMRLKHRAVGQVSTFWLIRTSAECSKLFEPVFLEPRHVHLDDRAGPAIGRGERLVAARPNIAINTRFAVAQNRARRVARRRIDRVLDPLPVARGDQKLDINASKSFGVRVLNDGRHGRISAT